MRKKIQNAFALFAALLICNCLPPSDQNSPADKAADNSSGDIFSTKEMTSALLEIEAAMGAGQIEPLLARYEKVYKADPRQPFNRFLWAFSLEDRNEAWAELTKITKMKDKFYWAFLGMGIILDGWKVDDQAEINFNKAIKLGPKIAIGFGRIGKLFLRKGDYEKALSNLQQAVDLGPDQPAYRLNLARALERSSKIKEAISSYQEIIAKNPELFTAHDELAQLLAKSGDKEAAIVSYIKAAELDQKSYSVRFALAGLQNELGRGDEALVTCKAACQLKPKKIECWQALFECAAKLTMQDVQVEAYENILAVDKQHLQANKFLAPIYLASGEIEKALPAFLVVLSKEKDNLAVLGGLTTIYEQGGEFSKALEFAARVLDKDAKNTSAKAIQDGLFEKFHIKKERITAKSPDKVFAKNRWQIAKVYKLRLKEKPGMRGDMLVKVTVADDGSVTDATLAKNTLGDQIIDLCALWNLRRSTFPAGFGATYDFELTLKPGG
ncbi:MAG: tetratricopeptide repeat protein [Deltaproteobacteria bacterium]|nr:tetratricopeptide repeat protein [Deltaproteobacteria bacterium]